MLKFYAWLLVAASILVVLVTLNTGTISATSYTYSGNLRIDYTINSGPAYVVYLVPATVGDTFNITLNYSGYTSACFGSLSMNVNGAYYRQQNLFGTFSDSFTTTNQISETGDVHVELGISCRPYSLGLVMSVSYTLDITVETPPTPVPPTPPPDPTPVESPATPVLPDPIIIAEEAAGLQRVQDSALPVVIYTPTPNNPDRFIDIRDLVGNLLLYISADDLAALPEFPTENLLIASTADGFVCVYKLTTGEYQVNVGPLSDGKIHVIIFDGIPRTHTYGYTLDVTNPAP